MEYGIAILVIGVGVLGYLLLRAKEKLGGFKVTIEKDNVEKEIIEENRKAKYANIHIVNNLTEPERTKLRKKWSRKK
jgi:hypothetical protein